MPTDKIYHTNSLQKFTKNTFIFHRCEEQEFVYQYADVLNAVESLLAQFVQVKLTKKVGIALKLSGHTPASCVLLLSILNHHCHFCPLARDDSVETELLNLQASGARYLIANTEVDYKRLCCKLLLQFSIFGEELYLSCTKTTPSYLHDDDDDLCYTIGTSGSTGSPKMVHVPYACIAPNVLALRARLNLTSHDVIFLCAPLTFDPFVIEFFVALLVGAALIVTPAAVRLAPFKLLKSLFPASDGKNVTILQMTPSLFRSFGADVIRKMLSRGSSLRALLLGGEEFPSQSELLTWLPVNRNGGTRIFNIYGITELSCWSIIFECNWENVVDIPKRIPLGVEIDSETVLRIVDEAGHIVKAAGSGELLLGSSTRRCYIPQCQGETSDSGVLFRRTGDLVERNDDGDMYYLGRLNNTIKRSGKRLCLDVLADKINALLRSDYEVRTVCLWDKKLEKLICCLTPTSGLDASQHLPQCRRLIQNHLSNAEKPDSFKYISDFPLNSHGKTDRNALLKILKTSNFSTNELNTPLIRFRCFLSETLALDSYDESSTISNGYQKEPELIAPPANKRQKSTMASAWSLSFTNAGGTSFQALSLAMEIGQALESAAEQRRLLELLLDASVTLKDISNFLTNIKLNKSSISRNETKQTSSTTVFTADEFKLKFCWRVDLGKCIDSCPALWNERYICVGSHSRLLLTLDATNGNEVARITLPDRIECKVAFAVFSPSSSFQLGFVGCYDGHLYGYDLLSGTIHCRINCGGMIKAQPVIFKDMIIVGNYGADCNLVSICIKTYKFNWRTTIGDGKGIFAAPRLFANNTLLVCALDGSYARVDVHNGHIQWIHKCQTPIFSTPLLLRNEGEIVLAEVSGKVHICSAASGEIIFTFQAGGNIFSSIVATHAPVGTADYLLFGAHDGSVYCLKYAAAPDNVLTLLWQAHLNAAVYAAPVVLSFRVVVACSTKGLITLLALDTGRQLATHDLQAEVFSTPCCLTTGRRIYFGCRNNYLYCLDIR